MKALPLKVSRWLGISDEPSANVVIDLAFPVKAVSKGRARMAAAGHMYTPERTVKFEEYISKHTLRAMGDRAPVEYPLRVDLVFMEAIPKSYKGMKRKAAELRLIFPTIGDIDNKTKAVTDAMNGVVYSDDRQIQTLFVNRLYGPHDTIMVKVQRIGLSQYELDRLSYKYLPGVLGD